MPAIPPIFILLPPYFGQGLLYETVALAQFIDRIMDKIA